VWVFFIFQSSKIRISQLVSSPLFPLPSVVSLLTNVAPSQRRVALPSYGEMSSLPQLHLSIILRPIISPLESKAKYWICTTTAGDPPWTTRLSSPTAIKSSSQLWSLFPSLNHVSILSPPYPEHHNIGASPVAVIPFHHHPTSTVPPHNNTHCDEPVNHLLLSEELIDIWIHVNIKIF
jgi:hypothetical protein